MHNASFTDLDTSSWMRLLASHYQWMRTEFPGDHLIVLFDIDGTIVDSTVVQVGAQGSG